MSTERALGRQSDAPRSTMSGHAAEGRWSVLGSVLGAVERDVNSVPMVEAFRRWAASNPEAGAVTVAGVTTTYRELNERSDAVARSLKALGVGQGDFVTLAVPNSIGFIEACLATLKLGAVVQPVSSRLPLVERRAIVELADSRIVVGAQAADHPGRHCVASVHEFEPADSSIELPILISEPWRATTSGGSTGRPKLIVGVGPAVVDLVRPDYLLTPESTVLTPGPLFHGGPFLIGVTSLFHGCHLILEERFDAAETLRLIERHQVQYMLLVPTMMGRIWRLDPEMRAVDLSSIETVLHLAAACPRWLKEAWLDWLGPDRLFELYGASDAPNRTIISGSEWLAHPGSVGRTQPGEFKITDAEGVEQPAGVIGEIWMKPPPGQPERSFLIGADQRLVDGWTSVGDLGWIDDDRYLYIADRRVDMIVTGGENVFPAEVESALEQFPRVRSSAVVGVPDDDLGWKVHAVVEVEPGVTEAELRAHMAELLVSYKTPRSYELVHEPVRDDAGKVRKSELLKR
jgi:bile acid-coenzyme A ligase